ncbi:uncharacterized protein LOC117283745 [Fukomys damarensis]|uniref:uncharacterized protein LOC117283745 n=1 Tax=Fukomys damarensis TaxID=885580 RepID=UPI0014553892|nr:uncharacterized protein LOC117283745 [Fukomys damarensis]
MKVASGPPRPARRPQPLGPDPVLAALALQLPSTGDMQHFATLAAGSTRLGTVGTRKLLGQLSKRVSWVPSRLCPERWGPTVAPRGAIASSAQQQWKRLSRRGGRGRSAKSRPGTGRRAGAEKGGCASRAITGVRPATRDGVQGHRMEDPCQGPRSLPQWDEVEGCCAQAHSVRPGPLTPRAPTRTRTAWQWWPSVRVAKVRVQPCLASGQDPDEEHWGLDLRLR